MYGLLIVIIYLAFFSLGIPDSLLGSAWPAMHEAFGVPVTNMGLVSMCISLGTIVSSLLSDRLQKKFGTLAVTIFSVFLTVLGLMGFSFSTQFWMVMMFSVPYGLGAGSVDAGLNNYVALHCKAKHMSWLHCFWGLGAIVSPFIMGYALTNANWNDGYRIVGLIQLAIAFILILSIPVWKKNQMTIEEKGKEGIGLFATLKIKGVLFLLLGFFSYCAAEATTMYWASTYFVEVKGITIEQAADLSSLFYIGMTVGRFIGGFITEKLGDRKMINLGCGISICGIVFLALPVESYYFAIVAFVVIGLGCAPIYPCIIHSTPENFGEKNSGAIIGVQMASAYAGVTAMPPLFGLIGKAIGFTVMPYYLLLFVVLTFVMMELTFRTRKKVSLGI